MPQTPINRLNNIISYLKVFALSVWVRISIMFDLLYGQFKSIKGLWSKQGYLVCSNRLRFRRLRFRIWNLWAGSLSTIRRIMGWRHGGWPLRVWLHLSDSAAAQYVHSHASPFPVEESAAQAFDLLKRVLNLVESINRAGLTSPWTLAGVRLWWEHIHQRVWAEEGQVREANGLAAPEPRSLPK